MPWFHWSNYTNVYNHNREQLKNYTREYLKKLSKKSYPKWKKKLKLGHWLKFH